MYSNKSIGHSKRIHYLYSKYSLNYLRISNIFSTFASCKETDIDIKIT